MIFNMVYLMGVPNSILFSGSSPSTWSFSTIFWGKKQTIETFANHTSIQVDQIRQKVTQIQMVPSFEKKTPICHFFFFDSESICERKSVLSIYLSQRWEVCKGLHFTDKRKQTTSFCNLNYEDLLIPRKENFDSPATSSRKVMLVKTFELFEDRKSLQHFTEKMTRDTWV